MHPTRQTNPIDTMQARRDALQPEAARLGVRLVSHEAALADPGTADAALVWSAADAPVGLLFVPDETSDEVVVAVSVEDPEDVLAPIETNPTVFDLVLDNETDRVWSIEAAVRWHRTAETPYELRRVNEVDATHGVWIRACGHDECDALSRHLGRASGAYTVPANPLEEADFEVRAVACEASGAPGPIVRVVAANHDVRDPASRPTPPPTNPAPADAVELDYHVTIERREIYGYSVRTSGGRGQAETMAWGLHEKDGGAHRPDDCSESVDWVETRGVIDRVVGA